MKTSLQICIRLIILIVLIHSLNQSNAQVGINNPTPNASSMLDITSTNKGVLIPRMSSAQRLAIPAPATGLMVYETTSNQFFYFDGAVWRALASGNTGWNVTGNAATVAGTNFIGTTDAVDLVTKTNNTEKMRVTSGGNVGIGTATPTSLSNYTSLCVNNPVNGSVIDLMTNGVYKMRLANTSSSAVIETNTGIPLIFSPQLTEAMRITPGGNVGIGTATPTSISNYTSLCINNAVNGGILDLMTNGVYKMRLANTSSSAVIETNIGIPLIFTPQGIEAMRVSANGNVGIGTSNPTRKLDIEGDIRIGVNGTTISNIIKVACNGTVSGVDTIRFIEYNFVVPNAELGSSVNVSCPDATLFNYIISGAYVSTPGNVKVKLFHPFNNLPLPGQMVGSTIVNGASFFITVIK